MKKTILMLLAASTIFMAACAPGVTLGGPETVNEAAMTDLNEGASAEPTFDAADLASESIGPDAITTPDPVFSDDATAFELEEPTVATPVPVVMATPGPTESFVLSGSTINVRYYDMETEQAQSTQYPVSDPTDPQAVVDAVTSALGEVNGGTIKLNSAQYSGGNLFLDFDPSIYNIATDSGTEHQILESIADTYLTNVDGIQAVFYTVDGKPYASDHTQLNENEAYKILIDNTKPN